MTDDTGARAARRCGRIRRVAEPGVLRGFLRGLFPGWLAGLLVGLLVMPMTAWADRLAGVEALVDRGHDVAQMPVDQARAALAANPEQWLVLDVRKPEEYAVSHLPGAQHVSPDTTADDFARRFGEQLQHRRVLVYCSVGRRSSTLADRVDHVVAEAGGQGIVNLRGGIFRWHGEHGPLVNDQGPVDRVHPYNAFWKFLMPRDNPPDDVSAPDDADAG